MAQSFTVESPIAETVDAARRKVTTRRELAEALGHSTRAMREYAAQVIVELVRIDADLLQDFSGDIVDALNRPESLTRYSMLEVIGEMMISNPRIVTDSYELLQECLYDEDSGTVRLYAFRVLARYGATGPARSLKVWPDLSMALRCFHGDSEFIAMLNELINMLAGRADQQVKDAAVELFAFDAENARGMLRRKARTIATFAPDVLERIQAEAQAVADAAAARKEAENVATEEDDTDSDAVKDTGTEKKE
ncbi:MAG: hypothetical protein FWD93_01710 [Coriobacteriia bacterium]|nr:hypothetical protein [Coriobacteriia bacterium]